MNLKGQKNLFTSVKYLFYSIMIFMSFTFLECLKEEKFKSSPNFSFARRTFRYRKFYDSIFYY